MLPGKSSQPETMEDVKAERDYWKKMALHDQLTGVFNRAGLVYSLSKEMSEDHYRGQHLMYIDLDGFKPINDTFGHDAGDEALRHVGAFLKSSVREDDIVSRIGGDEFIVYLKGASQTVVLERVEKIVEGFEGLNFLWENNKIAIRASIGMTPVDPDIQFEALMTAADRRLKEVKGMKGDTRNAPILIVA